MQEFRRTFSITYQTGNTAAIKLSSANGNVLLRSHDSDEVRINVVADLFAEEPREADEDFDLIKQGMTCQGNSVNIHTPYLEPRRKGFFTFGRGPRIDYDVRVPRQTSLTSDGRNGRIDVQGVNGPISVNHRNGQVNVEDCNRELDIDSHNGKIEVSHLGANVRITGHNGNINVSRVTGDATVETRNGTVDVSHVDGRIKLSANNGSIRYSGEVRANVDIDCNNGEIRLRVPGTSRFEIDAESVRGSVQSSLTVSNAPRSDAPRPRVRLRTNHGSIRIDPL